MLSVTGGPLGGTGGGVTTGFGAGGGAGAGSGVGGAAARFSVSSIDSGCVDRTVNSRSSVTKPSCSHRRRYVPSRRFPNVAEPASFVVNSLDTGPLTTSFAPGTGVPL